MKLTVLKNNSLFHQASLEDAGIDEGFEAYIGRSEDCHVLIEDPLISRHHLVLRLDNGEWTLEKLATKAIVSINGQALETSAKVQQGDLISLAPYSISLESLPGYKIKKQVAGPTEEDVASKSDPLVFTQTTHTGMRDDIPSPEEVEATAFMASPDAPRSRPGTSTLPTSERTQALMKDILSDEAPSDEVDELLLVDKEPVEGLADLDGASSLNGMNFEGEEDIIGSAPIEAETPAEGSATGSNGYDVFKNDEETSADVDNVIADGDEVDSTRVFQKFASYELLLFGEYAPYDRFSLEQAEIFIGRDQKKCQIILNDSEVSSVHAVIRKSMVSLVIEDLNSSNGTLLNGQRINKSDLTNGDEFIIGSTTFTVQIQSDLLNSEGSRLMPVESGQIIERIEEVEEESDLEETATDSNVDFSGSETVQEKSLIKRIMKDPKKKRIAMVVGVLLLIALLMDLEPSSDARKPEVAKAGTEKAAIKDPVPRPEKKNLSPEQIRDLEARYKIAEGYVKDKKLDEALAELERILAVDPDYANAKTLYVYVQNQNKLFKEEHERLKMEAEKARIREEVKGLLSEAKEAVTSRNVTRAEQLFAQVLEKDPENLEVTPLKQELEAWQAQERAKADAEAREKSNRARMVDLLAPGKKLYLSKEWHKAIMKLEEFLGLKNTDEDLIKEAGDMLGDAKAQLASELAPLLGKARSLKEGQDLKGAYEAYLKVLVLEPTNKEGLDEIDGIRDMLDMRSKKIYREAIISESLSLFSDAKEKFQEVQQISPTDSEYYKKASEKLRNYLE